jgi:ATP-dependent Clp protease ATP-binding subunit ClpB
VIQKERVDKMARKLLAGELEDGGVIAVTVGTGGLEIGKARMH